MDIRKPASAAELAQALAAAASARQTIALGGAFSKNVMAGPLCASPTVRLSTAELRRILQYEPNDLTISVEAGLPWAELCRVLGDNRQMIPLDPPYSDVSTVGGVVAANLSGPRRRQYGTARDHVIGMQFATLEGKLIQSGGMVVKNVAGLDMAKLMIGSFGTLAAITVVNFKLSPAPVATRSFVWSYGASRAAVDARDRILAGVVQPPALEVLNPAAAERVGLSGWCVAAATGGSQSLIERTSREWNGAEVMEGEAETRLWSAIREFGPQWMRENPGGGVVRFSHTLTSLDPLLHGAGTDAAVVARAGSGVAYAAYPSAERALAAAGESPFPAVVESAPESARRQPAELWPAPGDDLELMRRIKAMFDPHGLLNPGRLYGRI